MIIQWGMTVSESNYILTLLADRPYKESVFLIDKLAATTKAQVEQHERLKYAGASDGNDNSRAA